VIGLAAGRSQCGEELAGGRIELLDHGRAFTDLAAEVNRAFRDDRMRVTDRLRQLRRIDDQRPLHAGLLPSDQAA
jgi:hypothetical protein